MWSSYIYGLITIAYIVMVFSTAFAIVLENRQPAKTIAWIVVIWCVPVVGLILFYFFGQDIRRKLRFRRCDYEQITRQMLKVCPISHIVTYPSEYAPIIKALQNKYHVIATEGNHVELITIGKVFIRELLADIAKAKHHIHISMYIFADDIVGQSVMEALCQKAKEGVEVRLLYDAVGCWKVKDNFFEQLVDAGGQIVAFQPVRFPALTNKVNYRNHRKIFVVDGQIGYIGGMNLAERYAPERAAAWRDTQIRVEGEAVYALQRIFLSDWYFVSKELLTDMKYFPKKIVTSGACCIQMISSTPYARYPEIMYSLVWLFQNAKRYIYIQTPYFIPTNSILQALQTAALLGIDVRLMLPEKPDSKLLRYGNESFFKDVLAAGVRIFLYTDGFLHAKTIVIDDEMTSVGSANMDVRSFENNFEANAYIYNEAMARKMRQQFEEDALHCKEVNMEEWKNRSLWRKYLESHTRVLSPLF